MSTQGQPVVHYPSELETLDFVGDVRGYFHEDSMQYNIVNWDMEASLSDNDNFLPVIGKIVALAEQAHYLDTELLIGVRTENGLFFRSEGTVCQNQPYSLLQNIFSRNSSILETDVMLDKCAIISGCGSVGSLVALELARAGVGGFVLVDNDTIAYHNLCRHQCGVQDVGKYKVNAVKDRILQINPVANVTVCKSILETVDKEIFDRMCKPGAIIVGCADNREGDVYANIIACTYNIPFVSIGLWERAFAGEIFYSIPSKGMPCYSCPFGNKNSSFSNRSSTNRRHYTGQEELASVNFEPGISVDISFVTLVGIKVVIDLLNMTNPNYFPRVINDLSQFTLICNTSDQRIGGQQAEIFSYPLQVTRSIKIDYSEPCPPCKFL